MTIFNKTYAGPHAAPDLNYVPPGNCTTQFCDEATDVVTYIAYVTGAVTALSVLAYG